ncbi:hypothetical protein EVAR_38050_1 [Eumeta japonica]|uniref:Uncharacterized protein n=1 Tax=Eumeta variegata TaxID=151549 RepID=A0A4C1W7E6_EUMVA|nr:hypothetical protein EVAR_38050_1 [Eumeta japonica]
MRSRRASLCHNFQASSSLSDFHNRWHVSNRPPVILHYCFQQRERPLLDRGSVYAEPRRGIQFRNAFHNVIQFNVEGRTVASDVRYLSVVINWSSIHVTPSPIESRRRQAGLRDHS